MALTDPFIFQIHCILKSRVGARLSTKIWNLTMSWKKLTQINLDLSDSVSSKSETLSTESFLDFEKQVSYLKENGCLPEEFPVSGNCLFAFNVKGDWIAIAQRDEARTQEGNRQFTIEIVDLMPSAEFNRSYPKPAKWLEKTEITSIVYPYLVRVAVVGFATLLVYILGGKVTVEVKPDGNLIINPVSSHVVDRDLDS
jgi:hypothetical protein